MTTKNNPSIITAFLNNRKTIMADEVDRANSYLEDITADSEKYIRGQVPQERPDLLEDEEVLCEVCSSVIPHARARLGATLCVSCKEYEERDHKRNRRYQKSYDYDD